MHPLQHGLPKLEGRNELGVNHRWLPEISSVNSYAIELLSNSIQNAVHELTAVNRTVSLSDFNRFVQRGTRWNIWLKSIHRPLDEVHSDRP